MKLAGVRVLIGLLAVFGLLLASVATPVATVIGSAVAATADEMPPCHKKPPACPKPCQAMAICVAKCLQAMPAPADPVPGPGPELVAIVAPYTDLPTGLGVAPPFKPPRG